MVTKKKATAATTAPAHHSGASTTRQIVVVENGFVFLAESVIRDERDDARLNGASVIRVWGTTAGLGEIALKGPTKETVLDFCGNPLVNKDKVLFSIPCVYE